MEENFYNTVTIKNIDNEDFIFEYNKACGNAPYLIAAGQTVNFPRFLAQHATKHLIDKILNKKGMDTNNPIEREKLAALIVVKEENYQRATQLGYNEALNKDIENMNKPSDLDSILANRKIQAEQEIKNNNGVVKTSLPELDTTGPEEHFEGYTPAPKVEPEPDDPNCPLKTLKDEPIEEEVPTSNMPTRENLYKYAEDVLKMQMDKKTLAQLDKMSIIKLVTELDYPMEDKK